MDFFLAPRVFKSEINDEKDIEKDIEKLKNLEN